jgi:ribonuclease P protein component
VTRQFTLGPGERLKSRKSIEKIFNEGRHFVSSFFRVYYLQSQFDLSTKENHLKFGVGVSTKNFRKAVDRNRMKRLIREAYRLQKNPLQEKLKEKNLTLDLFFIYTGKTLPLYKEVYGNMEKIFIKLDKIAVEKK